MWECTCTVHSSPCPWCARPRFHTSRIQAISVRTHHTSHDRRSAPNPTRPTTNQQGHCGLENREVIHGTQNPWDLLPLGLHALLGAACWNVRIYMVVYTWSYIHGRACCLLERIRPCMCMVVLLAHHHAPKLALRTYSAPLGALAAIPTTKS